MAVSVNLQMPLISKLRIEGKIQRVEYENLPNVCYECGLFGHDKEACPQLNIEEETRKNNEEEIG